MEMYKQYLRPRSAVPHGSPNEVHAAVYAACLATPPPPPPLPPPPSTGPTQTLWLATSVTASDCDPCTPLLTAILSPNSAWTPLH